MSRTTLADVLTSGGTDLEALAALEAAATPGPWYQDVDVEYEGTGQLAASGSPTVYATPSGEGACVDGVDLFTAASPEDAALLVHLRNLLPDLIAAARAGAAVERGA
ncbi:hypothetical protein [Cellulosimicrobium sp. Marseille-Q4280]|uniref:hypothetical protein n=1 Tax=Cellulosimicrobium sp. Marseille-Q4280 TaxID=2937992 RepID=UPI00203E93AB|nr:hypothetical protein [Cellulosimicrobium sp. Marseille-Q4280]